MSGTAVCWSWGILQSLLEVGQRGGRTLGVLVDPAVVDEPDRYRIEEVQLLPPGAPGDDQPGVLEDAQVLHDAEAAHLRYLGLQFAERAAVTLEEPVEQQSPGRIGQRLEDPVVVVHATEHT